MQTQLVVMLILTSPAQIIGNDRPRPEPPRVWPVTTIHFQSAGEIHELTLEMPAPDGGGDDPPLEQPVGRLNLITPMLVSVNFDRWLFPNEQSETARQEHLTDILDAKIGVAASANKLTDRQRAKLRLAGRGDIKRFFDEVQKRKDQFETDRKTFKTGLATLRRLDELAPTYREGPFGPGSLFAKTLHKINNDRKTGS